MRPSPRVYSPYVSLFASYRQAVYPDGWGCYCATELQVIGDFGDVEEKIFQVSGHRDFFYRVSQFTAGDP